MVWFSGWQLLQAASLALEVATVHSKDATQRVVAGFLRFCVGARARGHDAAAVGEEPTLDVNNSMRGYCDAVCDVTKTCGRTLERTSPDVMIPGCVVLV